MYRITKRYGHTEGLSCAFRQWRAAETHCRFIHGYPLAFEFVFEGDQLDDRNWLISFGELKDLKQRLKDEFDHKTCVAHDDPELQMFLELDAYGIIQLNIVKDVGCEKFAEYTYNFALDLLADKLVRNNVRLASVMVSEHGGNSATYIGRTFFGHSVKSDFVFPVNTQAEKITKFEADISDLSKVLVKPRNDSYVMAKRSPNEHLINSNYNYRVNTVQ